MSPRRGAAISCLGALLAGCDQPPATPPTRSAIHHLVVVVQENHSFDTYFGRYCTAPVGSAPSCTNGPECCERGPDIDSNHATPVVLDDAENIDYDPWHGRSCETVEIDGGAMDAYTKETRLGTSTCGDARNFAYASDDAVKTYHVLASQYALADRYFQPVVGASTANDIFLARAGFAFDDNDFVPAAIGRTCDYSPTDQVALLDGESIGDLLNRANVSWRFYAEGYADMVTHVEAGTCPTAGPKCEAQIDAYPCVYDPADNPFTYSATSVDNPDHVADYSVFRYHAKTGTLPAVSFVKGLGYRTEHPGSSISAGVGLVNEVLDAIAGSPVAHDTLVLVTWDESGGFFDHVAPPPPNAFDGAPYGPRVPLLAIGEFARHGTVSHVVMEHSSIVKFIEWNWLRGTGLLRRRDALVNNIGSLLDPSATGVVVPD